MGGFDSLSAQADAVGRVLLLPVPAPQSPGGGPTAAQLCCPPVSRAGAMPSALELKEDTVQEVVNMRA